MIFNDDRSAPVVVRGHDGVTERFAAIMPMFIDN